VAVIGAVNQPGRFQLQRRARALELITFAGGPKSSAVGGVVHIIHNDELNHCSQPGAKYQPANGGNGNQPANGIQPANDENGIQPANGENGNSIAYAITSIKLSDMLAGSPESNPFVQPGDVISVPEADQIFVTGFVVRPGPFAMTPGLTLSQAVAMAGGANPEGSIGRVRLVRGTPGKGDRKETVYSLHDIHKRKIQDVALQANDIVEIPSSTSRIASRGALGVGLNLLNALPFFIIR
jgi:polysaccharide export outer membrane protein